jgi:NADPH2:quinone reductase
LKAAAVTAFCPSGALRYSDVEMPVMGPRQVLIRVAATSVNFADIKAMFQNFVGFEASRPRTV